jgi:hypothetical protein
MLEGARNLAAGRRYVVVEAARGSELAGPHFFRLQSAIDHVVTRTIATDPTQPGWRVLRIERGRLPELAWPKPSGDDGDGEEGLVARHPRRPGGSGAIALPFP